MLTSPSTTIGRLTSAPVLIAPSDNGKYILDSDGSDVALGCVLSQENDGRLGVVAYASRTLNDPEKAYSTTKKELAAVIFGLKQFRPYLLGREFVLRTDHAALNWLRRTPEPIGQQARWLSLMEEYTFNVKHRPGVQHGNADGLSRRPATAREGEQYVASAVTVMTGGPAVMTGGPAVMTGRPAVMTDGHTEVQNRVTDEPGPARPRPRLPSLGLGLVRPPALTRRATTRRFR
jgi:hypothetical protein